jgi:hypothetical protein
VSGGILCLVGAVAVTRLFPELGAHVVEKSGATVETTDEDDDNFA